MMNRNRRTILLGVLATATLVWSAIYYFGVPVAEMAWLLAYSVLGVLGIVLLAAASVALRHGLRLLWRKMSKASRENRR
ncbi:MAG: hypothetical protein O7F73_13180 [Gammaproteobacteria bacterium]|nr:hypothetical protein [Gammaproteobacteria bacterium]